MSDEVLAGLTKSTINTWLQELKVHDPALYDKLTKRMAKAKRPPAALAAESALPEAMSTGDMVAEAIIREGRPAEEIEKQIADDPNIAILVLAASSTGEGAGPLVSAFANRSAATALPVFITIVPAQMTDEQIVAIT